MVLMGLIASSLVLSQVISYGTTWIWLNAWSWEFMYPLLETSGTQESAIIRNKISAVWIKIFCVFTRKSHMYLEELLAVFAYDAQKTYYTVVVTGQFLQTLMKLASVVYFWACCAFSVCFTAWRCTSWEAGKLVRRVLMKIEQSMT